MNTEHKLNAISKSLYALGQYAGRLATAESHSIACWAALERHVASPYRRCGCAKHDLTGHASIHQNCDVGQACAEEYEIASRRVREMQVSQAALGAAP